MNPYVSTLCNGTGKYLHLVAANMDFDVEIRDWKVFSELEIGTSIDYVLPADSAAVWSIDAMSFITTPWSEQSHFYYWLSGT